MSWECECGVTNRDSRTTCNACGTPKGRVWTPAGFKPPGEAASVVDTRKGEQGYGWGWVAVIVSIANSLRAIAKAPHDAGSLGEALIFAPLIAAMALRQPWGWYVLLAMIGLSLLLFVAFFVVALSGQEPAAIIMASVIVIPLDLLWFVYYYKRRAMFGAKGRWRWLERTFPSVIGPEDEIPSTTAQGRDEKRDSLRPRFPEIPSAIPKRGAGFLKRQCPGCAESINVEETRCIYCETNCDADDVATAIDIMFNLHGHEFLSVDFKSAAKQCPKCAENIKLEARICKYCRREFTPLEVQIAKVKYLRESLTRPT